VERIVNNCITPYVMLKFPSEYELIHGVSPIQDAKLINLKPNQDLIKETQELIDSNFDGKPLIVIHDSDHEHELKAALDHSKLRYQSGVSEEAMSEIRQWEYGVLLLTANDCRGVDTRFAKDALVVIIAKVETYHQYLQMIGRSSRTRNACDALILTTSQERPNQFMERLKRQNSGQVLDLENLVKALESKAGDKVLAGVLQQELDAGRMPMSLKEVEQLMKPADYLKVFKCLFHESTSKKQK
jgi:hypothetical protein